MTDKEIAAYLADALEDMALEFTDGYNTMPRATLKRMAVENALDTLSAYRKHAAKTMAEA